MKMFGKKVSPDFVHTGKKALEDALGEQVNIKKVSFENGRLDLEIERVHTRGEGGWDANIHKHKCDCKM